MKKTDKKVVMAILVIFCLSSFLSVQTLWGEEKEIKPEVQHKIVRLYEQGGISPQNLTIQRGTTVIWINESKSIAEIEFTNKQVTLACKSPVRFGVDESGTYISDKIFRGAVASLCFVEAGEFEYVVKREPRRLATVPAELPDMKGKIIVK